MLEPKANLKRKRGLFPNSVRRKRGQGIRIKDLETGEVYKSEYETGKNLAHLVGVIPEDHFAWYKLEKRFPNRFQKLTYNRRVVKLAPSILSADFACLGEQVAEATRAGADYIHIDVMDGHFVPNITIGAPIVTSLRSCTNLPLDVHLMIEQPERYISDFVHSGANIITVHVEACPHLHRTIQLIKESGVKAGVALNPATPLSSIEEIVPQVDLIVIMSVNPGFGGQVFIPESLEKISRLGRMLDDKNLATEIEVDGGITIDNALSVVKAGGRVLVAGASVFKAKEGISQALQKLREAAEGEKGTY